jgi:hypothetical protein
MKEKLGRALACLTLLAVLAGVTAVPAAAAGFRDVPRGHWAAESIQRCVSLGFFQGKSAGTFGLGEQMTRSAFAVVLCRFFGWETPKPETATFEDVPVTAWYAGAVEAAYDHGAVTGQREDFRPNDAITREELAVMLVRALGYGTIAGLVQDLEMPFQDVTTNAGYLTMAYDLGLMSGTSATAFSPDKTAPREQVAVILMRLYDKLHSDPPEQVAVLAGGAAADLTGLAAAAIPGGHLIGVAGKASLTGALPEETAAQLCQSVRKAGAQALLYVDGGTSALNAAAKESTAVLAAAVAAGGYDGLYLDIPRAQRESRRALTQLTEKLAAALGDKPLYLAVEAPTWAGKNYDGYDYEALAAAADHLVLRVPSYEHLSGGVPTAPVNPLEEVYYALACFKEIAEPGKLTLMLDPEIAVWSGSSRRTLSDEELAELMAGGEKHYSNRYACAYLTKSFTGGGDLVAWYLDRQAMEERVQLAKAFGVGQLCLPVWDDHARELAFGTGANP